MNFSKALWSFWFLVARGIWTNREASWVDMDMFQTFVSTNA
jgi:hypothetical protein